MKILKKVLFFIINPINTITSEKTASKFSDILSKRPFLVFIIALVITTIIYLLGYFVL